MWNKAKNERKLSREEQLRQQILLLECNDTLGHDWSSQYHKTLRALREELAGLRDG